MAESWRLLTAVSFVWVCCPSDFVTVGADVGAGGKRPTCPRRAPLGTELQRDIQYTPVVCFRELDK